MRDSPGYDHESGAAFKTANPTKAINLTGYRRVIADVNRAGFHAVFKCRLMLLLFTVQPRKEDAMIKVLPESKGNILVLGAAGKIKD